jgi:hypothetical protein
MSFLSQVTRGVIRKPPIIGVMGDPGTGKSTFASQAPAPIFLQLEEGTNQLDTVRGPVLRSWNEVVNALGELVNEEHAFRTIVIDSADKLEHLIHKFICSTDVKKDATMETARGGYGKAYIEALQSYWPLLVDALHALRDKRGIGSILICHSVDRTVSAAETDDYIKACPKLWESKDGQKSVPDYLVAECDAWGYFRYDVRASGDDDGKRKLAKGGRNIVQHWYPAATHVAKNRYNITEPIPFNKETGFADFMAAWKDN